MRKLFLALFVLCSFFASAQKIQKVNTYGYEYNRFISDTLFALPGDTFAVPAAYQSYPFLARKATTLYLWNTVTFIWEALAGGVTSVYRKTATDSVFQVINNVPVYAFKDSSGGAVVDTFSISTRAWNKKGNDSLGAIKLNISDTANMRVRLAAGSNITLTGTYPNISIASSGGTSTNPTLWYNVLISGVDSAYVYGDSYTTDYGLSTGEGWQDLTKRRYSVNLDNYAVGGAGVHVAAAAANANIVTANRKIGMFLAGFNDLRVEPYEAVYRKIEGCLNTVIASNFIGSSIVAANSATKSGTFAAITPTTFGGGRTTAGLRSATINDYIETTLTGSNFIVGMLSTAVPDSTGGEIDILVDGALYGHYELNKADYALAGTYDGGVDPTAFFLKGLPYASHTIRIKVTTAAPVYFDYIATMKLPKDGTPMIVSAIPYMNAAGYAVAGTYSSVIRTDSANVVIKSVVDEYVGWPVVYVPINDYADTTTGMAADNVHRNRWGHRQLADGFASVMLTSSSGVGANPVAVEDGAGNAGYLGNLGDGASMAVNRNPVTGIFKNTSKAASQLTLVGTTSDTYLSLYLTSANNTIPTEQVRITKDANIGIGETIPAAGIHLKKSAPVMMFDETQSGGIPGYIGSYLYSFNMSLNRHPGTGAINIASRPVAIIEMLTENNNSSINLKTGTNNGGLPTQQMTIQGNGNVGIGDASPASTLTVGSGDLFQVNSSGNIVKINNVITSFPASQGAASSVLTNDGSGNWSWQPSSSGDMTIYTRQQDTITLVSFSAGARFEADTALFSTSTIYGSFYNDGSDTLIITKINAVMNGGTSDTLGYNIYYNDSINVIGTSILTATEPVTSVTVGNWANDDNYATHKIPPGNWVWLKTPTVVTARKPYYFSVSIIGYKKRVY